MLAAAKDLLKAVEDNLTDAHTTPGASGSEDKHYLIDMTMAFLAAESSEYSEHTKAVEEESASQFSSRDQYVERRIGVRSTHYFY